MLMKDHDPVAFVNAAVVVIPVLVIAMAADPINKEDIADPIRRVFASQVSACGLLYGAMSETVGLRSVLTGDADSTVIGLVSMGLIVLGAALLVPRLAELLWMLLSPEPAKGRHLVNKYFFLVMIDISIGLAHIDYCRRLLYGAVVTVIYVTAFRFITRLTNSNNRQGKVLGPRTRG